MTIKDYAMLAAKSLLDKKAEDVVVIDIQAEGILCNRGEDKGVAGVLDQLLEENI